MILDELRTPAALWDTSTAAINFSELAKKCRDPARSGRAYDYVKLEKIPRVVRGKILRDHSHV